MTYSLRPVPPAAVVTTDLAALTSAQQDLIVEGTLVTTSDTGERWQYTGTGSKTTSGSYVLISDVTPDWSIITNKPSTFPPDPHAITGHSASPNSITYADSTGTLNSLSLGSTGTVLTSLGTSSAPGFDTVPNLIPNGSITYAKIQAVTAADRVLGAATLAGVITEITCTSQARALLDDATAADMRTTLALGSAATSSSSDFAIATHAHGNISNTGTIGSTSNLPLKTGTSGVVETGAFGTGANEFCQGNDARLSDARTPTAHKASHQTGGTDALSPADIGAAPATGIDPTAITGTAVVTSDSRLTDARTPVSHTHGNLTNDGKVGSTSGLPLKTGTDGVLEAGAFGTSAGQFAEGNHTHADLHTRSHAITSTSDHTAGNHKVFYSNGSGEIVELPLGANGTVLTSAGTSSAPSFSAASGGISAIGTTAADILSVSGSDLVADDPNADRIVFWDDSAGKLTHLELGSGLTISGTTISNSVTGAWTTGWIPASLWIPRTTTGCGVDSRELATNKTNYDELLFDAGTDEFAQALVILPSNYNNSTITARFYWTASTGSGDVIFGIQGRAYANDDSLDTAFGTAQTVTDTLIATNDMHITSATSAVTIGGTPAANTPILFQIYRDADAGGDTLSSDARLLGVEISYTAA